MGGSEMSLRKLGMIVILACASAVCSPAVLAALFEPNPGNWGALQGTSSNCDDCFDGPIAFNGVGQTLNFFGTVYGNLYVGSNGYVTFGAGASSFSPSPLNVQTVGPMIAGLFTDLDSRNDAASNVYVNTSTPGQILVTWEGLGHFSEDYTVRSTFQLVIRSDQFAVPGGEGQIGFFYSTITDGANASAGFGDGLAASNPGEQAFYNGAATGLNNSQARWFNFSGGVPTNINHTHVAIPTLSEWGMITLFGLLALGTLLTLRRRQ
jgi:IPTL-CTERM motif/Nidogen-like